MPPIHQEVVFKANPAKLYAALTDAKQFSALSGGAPAEISDAAGGTFSCFGGVIHGRHVELLPGQRLVQAWRVKTWEPGLYSMVRFELKPQGAETRLVMDHSGFPEGEHEHLASGWEANYWGPLRKYLEA
jgi:activator of HSP90 ATPase